MKTPKNQLTLMLMKCFNKHVYIRALGILLMIDRGSYILVFSTFLYMYINYYYNKYLLILSVDLAQERCLVTIFLTS